MLVPSSALAQNTVTGKVVGSSGEAQDAMELILWQDSDIVKRDYTQPDGTFCIKDLNGLYRLQIASLGTIAIDTVFVADKDVNLGVFQIKNEFSLNEVTVKGTRRVIKKEVDKIIYNVSQDEFAQNKSAMEVLKKTPRITVDESSGTLHMIGRNGVKVMCDGKLISTEESATLIKNLRSSEIEKIEVIAIPSARYSANGNYGMINIISKKDPTKGLQGTLSNDLIRSNRWMESLSGNINLNYKKWQFRIGVLPEYMSGTNELQESYIYSDHEIQRNQNLEMKVKQVSANTIIKYLPSDNVELGVILNAGVSKVHNKMWQSTLNNIAELKSTSIETSSVNKPLKKNFTLTVYGDFKLDSLGKKINITYNSHYRNQTIHDDNTSLVNDSNKTFQNRGLYQFRANSILLNMEMPFRKGKLEFGLNDQLVNNDSRLNYIGDRYTIIDETTDDFKYKENVASAYVSATWSVCPHWVLKGGLRYEYTNLKGETGNTSTKMEQNYGKLFPTAFVMWSPSDNHQFTLNYSHRIQRPYFEDLNPMVRFYDVNYYSAGNPNLKPEVSDNMEIGYTLKGNLNIIAWGNHISDCFDYVPIVNADGVRSDMSLNSNKVLKGGFTVSYNWMPFQWVNVYMQGSAFYSSTKCTMAELNIPNKKGFGGSFNVYTGLMLNKAHTLMAEMSYYQLLPSCDNLVFTHGMGNFTAGIRYSMLNDHLAFSLHANDIFDQNISKSTRYFDEYKFKSKAKIHARNINLTVTWNFGKTGVHEVNRQTKDVLGNRDNK